MIVQKYNEYTKAHYKYDLNPSDFHTPMFDEDLHRGLQSCDMLDKTICAYCHTEFESRNKLFYHLGFMNIDIRRQQQNKKRRFLPLSGICEQLKKRLRL